MSVYCNRWEVDDWICQCCLKSNFKKRDKCFGCSAIKGDWKCPICNFTLFASKKECTKCKTQKPSGGPLTETSRRKGDWDCPKCTKFQFARNEYCRDCGSHKTGKDQNQTTSQVSEPDETCVVCMDGPKDTMLLHTSTGIGHTCVCFHCAQGLKNTNQPCPMCRSNIDEIIKNYQ